MNTFPLSLRAQLLVSTAMTLLDMNHLEAAPPRLDSPVLLPGGSVALRLTGEPGSSYTIDASTTLTNWFPVFTGIASNGLLTVRHEAGPNRPTFFYRGRQTDDTLPPLTVGPQLDTNITVSTLVGSAGGSSVLYGFGGTRFTFSLPSNSIPDPRVLKLTLVTNITGLPFASGMRGAVRIEPDDLAFWGAATLQITFPPSIDRRYLASFFCNADGSAFQLTPDRVGAGTITIPVTRAGVFGSSLISAQELADAARRETGGSATLGLAAADLHTAAFDCPAGNQAAANAVRRQLNAAQAAKSKVIAAALAAERQAQPDGATDDSPSALEQAADAICQFYQTDIAPKWPDAINNCAVGKVVTEFALGASRQRQLLGANGCTDLSDIPLCAMFQNCLEEIRQCCQSGLKGPEKVAAVLGLKRQDLLLGLNCISQAQVQDVIELCSSNAWTGTFSMSGNGFVTTTVTSQGTVVTSVDKHTSHFDGVVIESTEDGSVDTGFIIQLKVIGQLSYNTLHSVEASASCLVRLNSTEEVASGDTEYLVAILTRPDGGYVMFASHLSATTGVIFVPGTETEIDYQRTGICDPPEVVRNKILLEPTGAIGVAMPIYQGTMTAMDAISGTVSADDPTSTPPTTFSFKWAFKRHTVPP